MEFVAATALALTVKKILDIIRMVSSRDYKGVTTQLSSWLAGFLVLLLTAQTVWASGLLLGGVALDSLNFWSLVLAGISLGSTASVSHDILIIRKQAGEKAGPQDPAR